MRKLEWVGWAAALGALAGCGGGGGKGGPHSLGAAVGTTVVAGSLVEARHGHTATALADGQRVLIAGGTTLASPATRGLELWEGGQSRPLPQLLASARAGHAAVLLPDGRVWLLGGHDGAGNALLSTELWDPASEALQAGPDLLRPRDRAAVAVVGSVVYLATGAGEDSLEAWGLDLSPRGALVSKLPGGPRVGADLLPSAQDQLLYLQGGRGADDATPRPVWIDVARAKAEAVGLEYLEDGQAVVASLDGAPPEIYVLGGTLDDQPSVHLQRVRPGDTERIEVLARPLVGRRQAAILARPEGILLAGGEAQGWAVESVELIGGAGSSLAPPLTVPRRSPVATPLTGGAVLFSGGLGDDGQPVGLTELLIPPGAGGPAADLLYARAAGDRATRDRLASEVQRLNDELKRTQDALVVEGAERARVEGERDAAQARVRQREGELAQAQAQAAQVQQQLAQAQSSAQSSQAQLAQLQGQLAQAQSVVAARQQELGAAQAQLSQLQARLASLEAELNQLRAERDRLAAELAAARAAPKPRVIISSN